MSDLPPESRPAPPPEPDPTHTRVLPPDREPPATQRLSDRVWSFRSVIAVALVSVIVGGLGGAALASIAQDDDERRFAPGQGRFNGGGPGVPPGMDDRRRERMKQWRDQRGMGQRQWGQDRPPGVRPSGLPSPTRPTPTS